jgi:DNA-binding phage protein
MAKTKTLPWDAAEYLNSEEEIAAYLEAALEEDEPALVAAVLGDLARARGNVRRFSGLILRLFVERLWHGKIREAEEICCLP